MFASALYEKTIIQESIMSTLCLTNGHILCPQGDIDSLFFSDGLIADATGSADCEYDLEGDFLIPGLIELHTDNL